MDYATDKEESYVWVELTSKARSCKLIPDTWKEEGGIDFHTYEQNRSEKTVFLVPDRFSYSVNAVHDYMVKRWDSHYEYAIPKITKIKVLSEEQQDKLNREQLEKEEN